MNPLLEVKLKMHPDYPKRNAGYWLSIIRNKCPSVLANPYYIAPDDLDMLTDNCAVSGEIDTEDFKNRITKNNK